MHIFRYLRKGFSLRLVNLAGLTVTLLSLILSVGYIKHERSYDRHHSKADRIVRFSLRIEGEEMGDVRIPGKKVQEVLLTVPEIEKVARIYNANNSDVSFHGKHFSNTGDMFIVNKEFFEVFDVPLTASENGGQVGQTFVSRDYAAHLAAETGVEDPLGKPIGFWDDGYIAGIFDDFPETSHFQADILKFWEYFDHEFTFSYVYLLVKEGTDLNALAGKIDEAIVDYDLHGVFGGRPVETFLMPLTDIHLKSNYIRELDNNGNIIYIYLIISANILLVLIVLFNLFLNWSLILMGNEKRHRVNWVLGSEHSYRLVRIAKALNMDFGKSAKWIFVIQYAIVMLILVMSFGMGRQMDMVSRIQPGGDSVLVLNVPSDTVMSKLAVFKGELMKSSDVKGVTTVFQLPGKAIRDHVSVEMEGLDEPAKIPTFMAGEGLLPFFSLDLVAGEGFHELKTDCQTESDLVFNRMVFNEIGDYSEEYIINESALPLLGFEDASDAVGREIRIHQGVIDYINKGTIVGVVKDFFYTGTLNKTEPIIIIQRSLFQNCILIDLADIGRGMEHVRKVWNEVYPDYVLAGYEFMDQIYDDIYSNERNAVRLIRIFALICFIITDLGLIVFMAYIVKRRRKEIAVRKVNGATTWNIVSMLNLYYMKYILIAFIIAIPLAYRLLDLWLMNFAYRIPVDWSLFALAALTLILISAASVSAQSLRAASANPPRRNSEKLKLYNHEIIRTIYPEKYTLYAD